MSLNQIEIEPSPRPSVEGSVDHAGLYMVAYGHESALPHGDLAGSIAMDFIHDESSLIARVRQRRLHRYPSRADIKLTSSQPDAISELLRVAAAAALNQGVHGELSISTDGLDDAQKSLLHAYRFKAQSKGDSRISVPNPQQLIININNPTAIDIQRRAAIKLASLVPKQPDEPQINLVAAENIDTAPVFA